MGEAFPDGRFWLELGPNPPLPQLQGSLAAALGDRTPVTDVPQGRALLSRLLGERRCLLGWTTCKTRRTCPRST